MDHSNRAFHSAWPHCGDIITSGDGRQIVKSQGTHPLVFHLNGDAKVRCGDMYKDAWFMNASIIGNVLSQAGKNVTISDHEGSVSTVPAADICPSIWNTTHLRNALINTRKQMIAKRFGEA